jgi:lipopolysaccharide biosynthesis glycosyltransferase
VIRIFIGYDPREAIAYHVLAHSIIARTTLPVSITPLALHGLRGLFNRPREPLQSTDFSFTRFLVPALCKFEGWALFMDCDMLALDDLAKLWMPRDDRYAVQVVKHEHVPTESVKFLGQPQTKYEKKNWSSVMLFNNVRCRNLSTGYVARASGLDLHQFKWLDEERLIGALPSRWNHLVDYDAPRDDIALLHYTQGGPWFEAHRDCGYAAEWRAEKARAAFGSVARVTTDNVKQELFDTSYVS